jgi:hypothetical protein
MTRTEADASLRRHGADPKKAERRKPAGTFEPLLAGDRQRPKCVAKLPNPLQSGFVKSVCRELPPVALAA